MLRCASKLWCTKNSLWVLAYLKSNAGLTWTIACLQLPLHLYANSLCLKARQRQALRGTGLVRNEEDADATRTFHGVEEGDDDAGSEDIKLPKAKTSTRRKRLKPETPATDLSQQVKKAQSMNTIIHMHSMRLHSESC